MLAGRIVLERYQSEPIVPVLYGSGLLVLILYRRGPSSSSSV